MTALEKARSELVGGTTCVVVRGSDVCRSEQRGIAPMLDLIGRGIDLRGGSAADKIVGKAAAMLFVKAGITDVYAEVLSEGGREYLLSHGVRVSFGTLTEYIVNREGTGQCPMENTVKDLSDAEEGYAALLAKAAALRSGD